ncbi:hypothetical protein [Leifsonia shinshuensis]
MISLKRRLSTFVAHLLEKSASARWILLSTVLAAVGVLGVFVAIPAWINWLLAAISLVLLVIDVRRYRLEQRRTTFVKRPLDDFADVTAKLAGDERWNVIRVHGQTFVHDTGMSLRIAEGRLNAEVQPEPYQLPRDLKSLGGRYRRERIAKDSSIFNGPGLGWASAVTELPSEASTVTLVRGTFFDRLASDYFAAVDTRRDGSDTVLAGRRLFVDRLTRLRDFDVSWLFNGVGVSTIAVTSDGMFVITEQSVRNVGEQGLLAPSGSGSLEPKDLGGAASMDVAELSIAGANRELQEEASIEPGDIASSYFLGFGRWLNKAASPEVFAVTFLNVDSHELRRRKRRNEERVYVDGVSFVRPALPPDRWDPSRADLILPPEERGRVSLPLGVALSLLAREAGTGPSDLTTELRRRLDESFVGYEAESTSQG